MIQILTSANRHIATYPKDAPVREITSPVVLAQFRELGIPVSELIDVPGLSLENEILEISVFSGWGSGIILFHNAKIPEILGPDLTEIAWQLDNSGIFQDVQKAVQAVENKLSESWIEVPESEVPGDLTFIQRDTLYAKDLSFFSLEKHLGHGPGPLLPGGPVYYARKGNPGTSNSYICIRRDLDPSTSNLNERIAVETSSNGEFADFNLFSNLIKHKYVFDRYGIKTTSD